MLSAKIKYDIVLRIGAINRVYTMMFLCLIFTLIGLTGYAQSSVLSEGSWFRITTENSGIYKIRYEDLKSKGVLENPVRSSQIALFGGENGTLNEENQTGETFDLKEVSIFVQDGGDGQFGANDYILFYGQSPHRWTWNASTKHYEHNTNVYTRTMSYFLTIDFLVGTRKRVENKPKENSAATRIITDFTDHYLHENDLANPYSSSREWYGEKMDHLSPKLSLDLNLQGLITSEDVALKARLVFNASAVVGIKSGSQTLSLNLNKSGTAWMAEKIEDFSWKFPNARPTLSLDYTRVSASTSWVYLDYLEIHYRRDLSLGNTQMQFRSTDTESSEIGEFRVHSANSSSVFWEITNPLEPLIVQGDLAENVFSFRTSLLGRPEFIGFSENTSQIISQFEKIENQDLHGWDSIQYVIVAHPLFSSEAERLAEFHRKRNLNVRVTTPSEVFNEFSYGRQDPMGIRRMMRHLRNKAQDLYPDVLPEYLLLFGATSYDYLDRSNKVQNFVLNYQYPNGLTEGQSYSTDDMFGYLDNGETGQRSSENLDISIGRFPARNEEEAKVLVNKSIAYASNLKLSDSTASNFGEWRNMVANVADDQVDGSAAFLMAYEDYFENDYKTKFKEINVEKIYADAYPQVATMSGARYPAAKEAIKQRIERGALMYNYEGHSGVVSFADEQLMVASDVASFGNIDQLTLLFAASCSYSCYDNPSQISGGEQIVLSPNGGAVASIGASRVAYTDPNDRFHGRFSNYVLQRKNGEARSIGESVRLAKNDFGNNRELRQFILLGDPAIALALPKHKVVTTHVNNLPIENSIDTLKALEYVNISGKITDYNNSLLPDFNGEIIITVYDKPELTRTLGQKNSTSSSHNPVVEYEVQKSILFKGKTSVINGEFSVEFMTPKDINYAYGFGKISYYAYSDATDATGAFDSIVIGGFGDNFDSVAEPPLLGLYINDTFFVNGNITSPNPLLFARISDKYGINSSGSGIGHNISLTFDDDSRNQIYLNDYFEYVLGSSTDGEVRYPMFNLAPGKHNVKLKVWNTFNISTMKSLDFVVVEDTTPYIANAYCYPNPVRNYTHFYFTHNAPKRIERTEIDIFDIRGRWITRLSKSVFSEGFAIEPIEWNCTDANGNKLSEGLYIFKIRIVCTDGFTAEKSEKLIIDG